MAKEIIVSKERELDQPDVKPGEASQNKETEGGVSPSGERKTKKRSYKGKKKISQTTVTIIVGAIGALATIIAALIPILTPSKAQPSSTPNFIPTTNSSLMTVMIDTNTSSFTDTPVFQSETPSPTILSSLTSTMTTTSVPSETMTLIPQPKLIVLLQANKTSGRRPLAVKVDARESYLTDFDGQTYVCRNGACYYTWKVYSNGQQVGKSVTDSGGTFDYTFGKQGTYMITVWICRGRDGVDCGGSGVQIIVTK